MCPIKVSGKRIGNGGEGKVTPSWLHSLTQRGKGFLVEGPPQSLQKTLERNLWLTAKSNKEQGGEGREIHWEEAGKGVTGIPGVTKGRHIKYSYLGEPGKFPWGQRNWGMVL